MNPVPQPHDIWNSETARHYDTPGGMFAPDYPGAPTVEAQAAGLALEPATAELWEMSCRQYAAFAPGKHEWPALRRRCDRADPSYRN